MFFGEFLIIKNKISQEQLNQGLAQQKETSKPIGETLVQLGYLEESVLQPLLEEFMLQSADSILTDPKYTEII